MTKKDTPAEKKKRCFVVGPIGDDDSDDRIHADWLLEEIVEPVIDEHFPDFVVERADKIATPGRIDAQVITALLEAELVIADLTSLNPNAFYELGIRHMAQKPIIHMHLEGQKIPFDVASFRSIKFSRKRPRDLKNGRTALREAVSSATAEDHEIDNPVTFARGRLELNEHATPAERVLQEQLAAISDRLYQLERSNLTQIEYDDPIEELKRILGDLEAPNKRSKIVYLVKLKENTTDSIDRVISIHVMPFFKDARIVGMNGDSAFIEAPYTIENEVAYRSMRKLTDAQNIPFRINLRNNK